MPDTYTNEKLAEKIAWEGGLYEFVTSYGIALADIEDPKVRELFRKYTEVVESAENLETDIHDIIGYVEV